MSKTLTIAIREYRAMIVSKGFVVGLALLPIMFLGGMLIPQLIGNSLDLDDRKIAVIDRTGSLFPILKQASEAYNAAVAGSSDTKQRGAKYVLQESPAGAIDDEARLKLSDAIRSRELHAFLEISPELFTAAGTAPAIA